MTLREALTAATAQLAANPQLRETASRDAELLLLHTLQIPRTTLYSHPTLPLTPPQLSIYRDDISRRLTLEPIQYITGTQEFYGLPLHVTPAVLIPRPETELLVEAALARLPQHQPLRIADIGTGSGAIAIAIAHHLPQAQLTALDLSPAALAIAHQNAETHHVAERIRFLQSDLLSAVPGQTFDAILSNPPYIPTSDLTTLHPQVRDHEPHTALFAGPSGLDIYSRLIPQAHAALTPGGLLALEFGQGQSTSIYHLLADWYDILILNDLQQIPRVVLARRP
jgi:release factor glutamine methyltransferase